MKWFKEIGLIGSLALGLMACNSESSNTIAIDDATLLHNSVLKLTDVQVHDIFSPPVASRIYAYPSIAAYEVMVNSSDTYISLGGQLTDFTTPAAPEDGLEIHLPLASIYAYLEVGKTLIFSEEMIIEYRDEVLQEYTDAGFSSSVIEHSKSYGQKVADHILAWADQDNYKQTRTFPKFSVNAETGRWVPTPPGYMEAIEPHWSQIRPFVLDSSNQFIPKKPTEYDLTEGSDFYKEVEEVYEVSKNLTDEQIEIASFWDCNPYVMHTQGHVMFATKKITPGGHWMHIAEIVSRDAKQNMMDATATYALTSISIADAFISCWDEKYRSNLIRPETLINKYIDDEWLPVLQTPPFPEYTSGHSVVSGAGGIALTHLFGDVHFVDSTEVKYGLPVREFDSFIEASDEAAISRLYGGIHYMPAIVNGVEQGRSLGRYLVGKIQLKKTEDSKKG